MLLVAVAHPRTHPLTQKPSRLLHIFRSLASFPGSLAIHGIVFGLGRQRRLAGFSLSRPKAFFLSQLQTRPSKLGDGKWGIVRLLTVNTEIPFTRRSHGRPPGLRLPSDQWWRRVVFPHPRPYDVIGPDPKMPLAQGGCAVKHGRERTNLDAGSAHASTLLTSNSLRQSSHR